MKAIIVSRAQHMLDELRHALAAEGHEVTHAILRRGAQPLAGLLPDTEGHLLLVDSGAAAQADLASLAPLTAAHPELGIAILSTNRDADTLIAAMHAGVREVLASPPVAAELSAALGRLAQRNSQPGGTPHARVIAFVSCKGGSGATFLATNIGYLLAAAHGKSTALVDLDLRYGDASFFVTEGPGKASIADLARQADRLDERLVAACMTQVVPHFDLLAAPEDAEEAVTITATQVQRVLDVMVRKYEYVILDVERVLDPTSVKALDRAEMVYLVLENMIPFVRDARRMLGILRSLGYPDGKLHLVVNRYRKGGGIEIAQLEKAIGLPVAHVLAESFADVAQAVNAGVALDTLHPHNSVARGLRAIADEIAGGHVPRLAGWLDRLVGAHE